MNTEVKQTKQRLFLIDGMALIYRSHFAMINNPLKTRDGRQTSAIYGFMNGLLKLVRDENPDYLAVVLDSPEKTFRHEIYTDYKATREKMPEELVEQIEPLYEVISAVNIPMVRLSGYEADDIIGTLAVQAEKHQLDTYIFTGDKDMMQLITDSIFVYSPGTRFRPTTVYDRQAVIEKWGVPPEKIIELLALVGDASDNVPGVDGVGPKTAAKLLQKYGTIANILDHIDEIGNRRVRSGLENGRDLLPLCQDLVSIRLDVPINLHVSELQRRPMNIGALTKLLTDLEMPSVLQQLGNMEKTEIQITDDHPKDYRLITTGAELEDLVTQLTNASLISFDTETTSVVALEADIVGLSFSITPNTGWYIPVQFPERNSDGRPSLELGELLSRLKPIFEDEKSKFCGQNIKYDALVMSRYNIDLNGIEFDTMIAAHLLRPEARSYKLDVLSLEYLQYKMVPISNLIGSGKNQKLMSDVPLDEISFYAAEDADVALQLAAVLKEKIFAEGLSGPMLEIEMPLIPVLAEMEKNGVYVDLAFLNELSGSFGGELGKLEEQIYDMAGREFNINSPQQLGVILFDELGLKPIRKRSTDVTVLERLKSHHPLPRLILDYRHLKKLKTTYIDAFPNYVNPTTGRIHTSLNQTIAATGRLSSTRPNFQNIPVRTELGREIRKAFTPQKTGWKILSADYSQIELRIMAHYSNEPELVRAFQEGIDIHSRTASLVFDVPAELVTDDMRRSAKVVNFGIMYGAGPYRMSQELSIPMKQARELINSYFNTYPGIRKYIEETLISAREKGFVTTLFGRKRHLPNLTSTRVQEIQAEERAAINMPIQGTAAELIKLAMIRINEKMKKNGFQSKMILQIHDELLFEVPESELESLTQLVVDEMENAIQLNVPLKVDCGVGDSWYEAH
ncbi:MAG: DNA polymerase I [FCB group bacterium]|nr:DNA polymerase I [FCB group bacterium]